MLCQSGTEWDFSYVLTGEGKEENVLVVPRSLHMGWTLSPAYLCTAIETSRDVA